MREQCQDAPKEGIVCNCHLTPQWIVV
jgi:hypothetical protein